MTATTTPAPVVARWRRPTAIALAVAAAAFSTLVIPGLDALVGGWFLSGADVIHRVHEVGFGLIMTVCIAAPLLTFALAPSPTRSMSWATIASPVATIALLAASGLAADSAPFVILLAIGLAVIALRAVGQAVRPAVIDPRLLTIAVAASVPLLFEAWVQIGLQRAATADDPHAFPPHYAGMAALAVSIAALAVIAAWRTPGHRVVAALAAVAAVTWAIASLLNLGFVGALSAPAAIAAIATAGLYLTVMWRPDHSGNGHRVATTPSLDPRATRKERT